MPTIDANTARILASHPIPTQATFLSTLPAVEQLIYLFSRPLADQLELAKHMDPNVIAQFESALHSIGGGRPEPMAAEAAAEVRDARPRSVIDDTPTEPLTDVQKAEIKAFFGMLKNCRDADGKELSVGQLQEKTTHFLREGLGNRALHEVAQEFEKAINKDWVARAVFSAVKMFGPHPMVTAALDGYVARNPNAKTLIHLLKGALARFSEHGLPGVVSHLRQNVDTIQLLDEKQVSAFKKILNAKAGKDLLSGPLEKIAWAASVVKFLGSFGEQAIDGNVDLKIDLGAALAKRALVAFNFVCNFIVEGFDRVRIAYERRQLAKERGADQFSRPVADVEEGELVGAGKT